MEEIGGKRDMRTTSELREDEQDPRFLHGVAGAF